MLHRDMDISKVALEPILAVNRIRTRRMEYDIHRSNGFMHAMGNRQPRLRDLATRIWRTPAHGCPGRANGMHDVRACGIDDRFGLRHLALDQGTMPQ